MTSSRTKFTKAFFALLILAVVSIVWYATRASDSVSFDYFSLHCSVFKRDFAIIYNLSGHEMCAFKSDGSVLAVNTQEDRFSYFDANDKLLWSSNENIHHDLKFSLDEKRFLLISSEIIQYAGQPHRSDCFSVRDLQNKILHQWCLGAHLAEMKGLGFRFPGFSRVAANNRTGIASANFEISHANSIYEIGHNRRSGTDRAFEAGNYIVNVHGDSCAILILDREMKKILWHKNLCKPTIDGSTIRTSTHDVQVTKEGNILLYLNSMESVSLPPLLKRPLSPPLLLTDILAPRFDLFCCVSKDRWHSELIEFDPYLDTVWWHYADSPTEKFMARFVGSVTRLANGNFLYSATQNGGYVNEITVAGKKVWRLENLRKTVGKDPNFIVRIKPFDNTGFFVSRHIPHNEL